MPQWSNWSGRQSARPSAIRFVPGEVLRQGHHLAPGQPGVELGGVGQHGNPVPIDPEMEFEPGDVLHATGHRAALDRDHGEDDLCR